MAILTKEEWLRQRRRKRLLIRFIIFSIFLIPLFFITITLKKQIRIFTPNNINTLVSLSGIEVDEMFLTPNKYSRPQTSLHSVKNIVIHYTGNPGTTAIANRNYFENLKTKKTTYASSHYIVGLDGEIIQCLPLNEMSYASNHRNPDTISIETCHPDAEGKFSDITYDALVKLVAHLLEEYDLDEEDVIRHYDVTHKHCPLYYVENPEAWEAFKSDVKKYLVTI